MPAEASALVGAGLATARLVFGAAGSPVPAAALAERGARWFGPEAAEPAVAALLTNDRPSVELVLGALVAGARVLSLPLPARAADPVAFGDFVRQAGAAHGISRVVARDDVAALLDGIGVATVAHSDLGGDVLAAPAPGGFELVQFSSGSTGKPKGIVLDDAVLGTNVAAILEAVRPRPGDATVSWLPLSHDMGLIGMLFTSLAASVPRWTGGTSVVLLEPEAFLRAPASWVEALDHWGGTFTAAPDFGFRLAAQRPPTRAVDLAGVRCAIVGGEIVRADTMRSVAEALRPHGFDRRALCPAYGMAELGLAATMTPPEEEWREEALDVAALAEHRRAAPAGGAPEVALVASGLALDGYRVEVEADPGGVGPLRVVAPAVGSDAASGRSLAGPDGAYPTGDVGFLDDDGWLYVCGRDDDHVVVHGRSVYAPAVEAAVSRVPGVRPGRVTALGGPTGEWVVVAERSTPTAPGADEARRLRRDVRRAVVAVASAAPDHVVLLRPGLLPLTSSGKLQRHETRRRWLDGTLEGE